MSVAILATSLALNCAVPTSAKAPDGSPLIAVLKVAIPDSQVGSVQALQPPTSDISYAGETGFAQEWAFAQENKNLVEAFELARISVSGDAFHPFNVRYGAVTKTGSKKYRFEEVMRGKCMLKSAESGTEPSQ